MDNSRHNSPFSWIRQRRAPLDVLMTPASETAFHERMLRTDRTAAAGAMVVKIAAVLDEVFGEVYSEEPGNRVHLLRTGTGTGKSSRTFDYIAQDPRTYLWDGREDSLDYRGPILFLLPTYANIDELRLRAELLELDPSLTDAKLAAQARGRGLVHEDDVDAYVAAMADKRLRTEIYRGKVAAGCKRVAEMLAIIDAGLPTAGLCRSRTLSGGISHENFCVHYDTCGAITQRDAVKTAHVVFAPRSFLDLRVPEELEHCRAVIGDEAVWTLLVHSTTFPLSALDLDRDAPRLGLDDTMTAKEMLGQRSAAVPVVKAALMAGADPAQALLDYAVDVPEFGRVKGLLSHSARHAARVTQAAVADRARIDPGMSLHMLSRICAKPTAAHLAEEHRFWTAIAEKLDHPRPGTDFRVQLLDRHTDSPQVRVSWLTEANWGGVPLLLLDASGDPEITARCFPGREIVVHDVPVSMNIRTMACLDKRFAIRNIVPGRDATPEQLFNAAQLLHEIRCVISAICGAHANGRVLVGMPKKVRKAVQHNWTEPTNCDFLHSGAEAGLNFARQHVAVVSISRLEIPVGEIDAQVAALTGADDMPELPIDRLGTGMDENGDAIYPHIATRTLRLRDGSDMHFMAHEHAGPMARRVQYAHREERIRQLIGRLRAFYREDTTACYVIGQAVPDDLVVDEACTWSDLVGSSSAMWDVVRMAGGLLSAPAMLHASPEGGTLARYKGWIDRLPDAVVDGYHGVNIDGQDTGVPGHVAEIGEFLAGKANVDLAGLWWSGMHAPAAPEGRPMDAIEARLGDRQARHAAEKSALGKVRELVQRRGEWKPAGLQYRGGTGDLQMKKAPLGVWAALATLRDAWIYSDAEAVAPVPVKVAESRVA